jgi:hypothetical protein
LQNLTRAVNSRATTNTAAPVPAAPPAPPAAAAAPAAHHDDDDNDDNDGAGFGDDDDDDDADTPPTTANPRHVADVARREAIAVNAMPGLRNCARMPAVGIPLKSWVLSIEEWEREGFGQFKDASQREWSTTLKGRFNPRVRIYEEASRMTEVGRDLIDTAHWLDVVRTGEKLTLNQHLMKLRKENPAVKTRNRPKLAAVVQAQVVQQRHDASRVAGDRRREQEAIERGRRVRAEAQIQQAQQIRRREGVIARRAELEAGRHRIRLRKEVQAQILAGRSGGNWEQTGHTSGRGRSDPMDDTDLGY